MRSWVVAALAAVLIAGAIAVEAPASLVDRQLGFMTEGRLRVADAVGTIWNGTGALVLLPAAARLPVRWHIDALPLLHGGFRGTLGLDSDASQQAAFDFDSDDFSVRGLAFSLPAQALLRAGNAPAIVATAGGTVDVHADAFAMHHGTFEGGFVVRWLAASLPGTRPDVRISLGDLRLDALGSGPEVRGALSNVGGDIEVNGTSSLTATGARVDARLKPRSGIDAERAKMIVAALSMIGVPDGADGFRVVWQGTAR